MSIGSGYGLWTLAVLNAALFIFFAYTFYTPSTRRDWRTPRPFSRGAAARR